jgi:hypothetical protein
MVNRIDSETTRSPRISDNIARDTSDRLLVSRPLRSDDIISSLANAHENRRARQVTEWQQLGAKTFRAVA